MSMVAIKWSIALALIPIDWGTFAIYAWNSDHLKRIPASIRTFVALFIVLIYIIGIPAIQLTLLTPAKTRSEANIILLLVGAELLGTIIIGVVIVLLKKQRLAS